MSFDVTSSTDDEEDAFLGITVNDEDNEFVTSISQSGVGTDSSIVNEAPGAFFLDVVASSANYTITVEDCTEAGQGDTTNNEDTDDVIDNTIPRKPLPDTGGSTVLMVGGPALLLLYGSLVAWRLKIRKR